MRTLPNDINIRSWTWRHGVLKSGLPSTTRLVLLTISCHMNDVGEGAYPSTALLAAETGLSERSICTHIDLAAKAGWLTVKQHGFRGQKWKRHEYYPRWPDDDGKNTAGSRELPQQKGTEAASPKGAERGSVPSDKGTEPPSVPSDKGTEGGSVRGTEPRDKKALKEVQCSIPSKSFHTHSQSAGAHVCVIFDLDLDNWQMRVAEHFIAPLERALTVRSKHTAAMADMIPDLAIYSSATLIKAAARLRRERSIFPTIAQAVAACVEVNSSTYRPANLVKGGKAWTAWRADLERQGKRAAVALMDRKADCTVDANLLDDLLAHEKSSAEKAVCGAYGSPQGRGP